MTLSNTLANAMLSQHFSAAETWLSLHSTEPVAGGLSSGELTAVNYHRQRVVWSPAANRAVTNDEDLSFSGLPRATIPWLGLYDAEEGGSLLAQLAVDPPYQTATNGSMLYLPEGTLVVELPV